MGIRRQKLKEIVGGGTNRDRKEEEAEQQQEEGNRNGEESHGVEVILTAKSSEIDKFFATLERERIEEEELLNENLAGDIENLCQIFERELIQSSPSPSPSY